MFQGAEGEADTGGRSFLLGRACNDRSIETEQQASEGRNYRALQKISVNFHADARLRSGAP